MKLDDEENPTINARNDKQSKDNQVIVEMDPDIYDEIWW